MAHHDTFHHPAAGRVSRNPALIAVRWAAGTSDRSKRGLLTRRGLRQVPSRLSTEEGDADLLPVNHTDGLWWVERRDGAPIDDDALAGLERAESVAWIAGVYSAEGMEGAFCVNPTRVYLPGERADLRAQVVASYPGASVDARKSERLPGLVAMTLEDVSFVEDRGALALFEGIAAAAGPEGAAAVRLENIPMLSPLCAVACAPPVAEVTPDDPRFPLQWNLQRINAPRAWSLTQGDPGVVVAVIDQGVELAHPDLTVHPMSWNASTDTPDGSPVGNHGTACAGIVAAVLDNAIGMAGVAGRCQVMAIATSTWADIDIAESLYFAADNGAHVVSMSFGVYPSWGFWDFDLIRDALQYAQDRGLVLVAATGNENIATSRFPGSDRRTIGVGGTNRADLRKSVGDTSIEPFWGACYGPDLDVVAPCLEIPTTDRLGGLGYSADDYYNRFNGTSSATPHVAGLAALVLSVDRSLSNETVREIIESTCDKVNAGTYAYALVASKTSGTWNNEVGYGRINAERALLAACSRRSVPDDLCDCCHRPKLECVKAECVSPPGPSWSGCDPCIHFYENRFLSLDRLQVRIVYEHCLELKGRQQGPLIHTTTLLPGETVRLYHYDRYRRIRSETQRLSVRASLRQTVQAVWEARTTSSERNYQEFITRVRSDDDSSFSVGGMLFPVSWTVDDPDVRASLLVGASVETVASEFERVVQTSSQHLEAERSIVISTYEDSEVRDVTSRTLHNANPCHAVTYFVRQVYECYELSTKVAEVSWRVNIQRGDFTPWRPIDELPEELREKLRRQLEDVPRVGETVSEGRTISLPTDGALYQPELAHCPSCDPLREEELLTELDRARHEARLVCHQAELVALEVERRRKLLARGELAPFEPPPVLSASESGEG